MYVCRSGFRGKSEDVVVMVEGIRTPGISSREKKVGERGIIVEKSEKVGNDCGA